MEQFNIYNKFDSPNFGATFDPSAERVKPTCHARVTSMQVFH